MLIMITLRGQFKGSDEIILRIKSKRTERKL